MCNKLQKCLELAQQVEREDKKRATLAILGSSVQQTPEVLGVQHSKSRERIRKGLLGLF